MNALIIGLEILAALYGAMGVMWILFLAVMSLRVNQNEVSSVAKIWAYPILVIGLVADALFNIILGTLFFVELPHEILFTARCERHIDKSTGWRHNLAKWFCRNFLDPFDINNKHC